MRDGRIDGDCWDGIANHAWHIDAASVDDLDRALERLDARTYTLVTIQGDGEQHLTIGGGAGHYVVYATSDNQTFWNLMCPQPTDGVVRLNAGGQDGDYAAAQVVDLPHARAAARMFHACRALDPQLRWDRP